MQGKDIVFHIIANGGQIFFNKLRTIIEVYRESYEDKSWDRESVKADSQFFPYICGNGPLICYYL